MPARRRSRRLYAVLLWLVAGLALAAAIVPHFLDRIYYRGPAGGHFDGARFFNPDGDDMLTAPGGGSRGGFFWRYITGSDSRPPWPERVRAARATPPARVAGDAMTATWVGHATVLVQSAGLNILTDPIWSDHAGPFGVGPSRVVAPGIAWERLPKIDLIVVSHNHYDHMDVATLKRLWERDRPLIVTSLGNDAILRANGIESVALDWGQSRAIGPGRVHVTRNHHWGSRWFADRNRALWSSFVIALPAGNIVFAGDTGFGDGAWPGEAAALGPVRLAIIPIGAFRFVPGQMGTGSHIGPIEAVKVYDRMAAATALPIHWGTFRLSYEAWDTPPRLLTHLLRCAGGDPARFRAHAIGVPFAVPAMFAASRRPDETRLEACAAQTVERMP